MLSTNLKYDMMRQSLLEQKARIDFQLDAIELISKVDTALDEEARARSFTIDVDIKNRNIFDYIASIIPQESKIISFDSYEDSEYFRLYFLINLNQLVKLSLQRIFIAGYDPEDNNSYTYHLTLEVNSSQTFFSVNFKPSKDDDYYDVRITNLEGTLFHSFTTHQNYAAMADKVIHKSLKDVNVNDLINRILNDYGLKQGVARQ